MMIWKGSFVYMHVCQDPSFTSRENSALPFATVVIKYITHTKRNRLPWKLCSLGVTHGRKIT